MFWFYKNHIKFIVILFIILNACQFQEPLKNHGIVFLENRANKLQLNKSNKNDVIKILGNPHSKSITNDDEWIYIERILTKGEYHKLGRNVLKANNVLKLNFDKFGILKEKKLLDKNDRKKIVFSTKKTENVMTKKSFVHQFLSSVKQKMYGGKN